jgi:pilus assembly protein Flp/PilA
MKNLVNRIVREEQGQDLIEYALLAGLISLGSIVGITFIGTSLLAKFNQIGASVVAAS